MAEKKTESINIADMTKQAEKMLAEARKAKEEAEQLLAEVKATAIGSELTDEEKKKKADRKAYWEELVEVKLFKDNNKYKDDVFVSVNGENCVIKRGERVRVKRKFAQVLDQSDMQDYETSKLIEQKSEEYAKREIN